MAQKQQNPIWVPYELHGAAQRFQPARNTMPELSGPTEEDLSKLSHAAVLFGFKDACTRYGELEHKKFISALYGMTYEIPQAVTDQVALYGAEVYKRMQG